MAQRAIQRPDVASVGRPFEATVDEPLRCAVYIEWIDSSSLNGWQDHDTVVKLTPYYCRSVGLLVYEDDQHIIIATSETYGADGTFKKMYTDPMSIPVSAIIRRFAILKGSD